MLMPKRVKWRKQQRGRMTGKELRGVEVAFGDLGLQALEPCWMTQRQIEAARRAIVRFVKRRGKMWVRIFPDKPVTKKAAETRMGKGKGAVDHYVAVIKPGRIILEIGGLDDATDFVGVLDLVGLGLGRVVGRLPREPVAQRPPVVLGGGEEVPVLEVVAEEHAQQDGCLEQGKRITHL